MLDPTGYLSPSEQYADHLSIVKILTASYLEFKKSSFSAINRNNCAAVIGDLGTETGFSTDNRAAAAAKRMYDEACIKAEKAECFLPFEHICNKFGVPESHKLMVMACLLPCIYPTLLKVYGYLCGKEKGRLTVSEAAELFCEDGYEGIYTAVDDYLPLIFDMSSSGDPANAELVPLSRIALLLTADKLIFELPYSRSFTLLDELSDIYGADAQLSVVRGAADTGEVIYVCGEHGSGKTHFVKHAAHICSRNLILADTGLFGNDDLPYERVINELKREALLQQAYVCLENVTEDKLILAERIAKALAEVSGMAFITGDKNLTFKRISPVVIKLGEMSFDDSVKIWQAFSKPYKADYDIEAAAGKYRLNPAQIGRVIKNCVISSDDGTITDELVEKACIDLTQDIFTDKAVRIHSTFRLSDLILPEEEKMLISECMDRVRLRHKVFDRWNFGSKLTYGRGLSVLFDGPPGTGKTMAATIIGGELALPVFKIDISKLMSKYIGETEKSLGKIFDIAQKNNAVLFFDETDAIFGKRSEIKDSHDRYANVETSYLLQKMEEYDGITIMTTNFRQNIDTAFIRRISYIIRFPFPEQKQRLMLWKSVFPKEANMAGDADFYFLSERFEMSGAMIKNAAVSAAFLAAARGDAITMADILQSVKAQLTKSGKTVTSLDLGPYAALLDKK